MDAETVEKNASGAVGFVEMRVERALWLNAGGGSGIHDDGSRTVEDYIDRARVAVSAYNAAMGKVVGATKDELTERLNARFPDDTHFEWREVVAVVAELMTRREATAPSPHSADAATPTTTAEHLAPYGASQIPMRSP